MCLNHTWSNLAQLFQSSLQGTVPDRKIELHFYHFPPRFLLIMIHMNEWTRHFNVNKVLTAVWDSVWIRCSVCYISIRLHVLFAYFCNSFDLIVSEFEAETKIHSAILRDNSFGFWFWFGIVNVLHVSWIRHISYLKWRHWQFH